MPTARSPSPAAWFTTPVATRLTRATADGLLRADRLRDVPRFAPDFFADDLRAADLRPVFADFLDAPDLRAAELFRLVLEPRERLADFRPDDLRADFFPDDLRADAFRPEDLRAEERLPALRDPPLDFLRVAMKCSVKEGSLTGIAKSAHKINDRRHYSIQRVSP